MLPTFYGGELCENLEFPLFSREIEAESRSGWTAHTTKFSLSSATISQPLEGVAFSAARED
jgi:hypothetical protein